MSIIHEKTPTVMAGVFLFSHIDRTVSHAARSADSCQCSRKNRFRLMFFSFALTQKKEPKEKVKG